MHLEYSDIIERAGEPDWYDEHGTPRYGERTPRKVTVYGEQVVFYRIACQGCGKRFIVAESYWSHSCLSHGSIVPDPSLEQQIREGWLHYGDPPFHHDDPAGSTMNCDDLEALEFWRRGDRADEWEWRRVPELEIGLEDLDVAE